MRGVVVLGVALVSLAGLWAATEYVASELHYAPALGPPWWQLGELRVSRTPLETLDRMLKTSHLPTGPHPVVAQTAQEAANKHDKELSSVWSTALSYPGSLS